MSDLLSSAPPLEERLEAVFGDGHHDPMPELDRRARERLHGHACIVWEADAATFAFTYVSESAEWVLGYPLARWTTEPGFWAEVVVHPGDRDESVSYCVAETGACRDHAFEYRARAIDGRVVRLRDYVRVVTDAAGRPSRLRGVMLVVPGGRA